MKHDLKIESQYFERIKDGSKNFEIRKNDRGFNQGDTVVLSEYWSNEFTGNKLTFKIGFVTNYGQKDDTVVFSLLEFTTGSQPEEKK